MRNKIKKKKRKTDMRSSTLKKNLEMEEFEFSRISFYLTRFYCCRESYAVLCYEKTRSFYFSQSMDDYSKFLEIEGFKF